MISGYVPSLYEILTEICGQSDEEAAEEAYLVELELSGVELDDIYRGPTEEERLASLLQAA